MNEAKVKLAWIEGEDAEEFADIVGSVGVLRDSREDRGHIVFMPEGRGDWLTVAKPKVAKVGGKLRLTSRLGNTYVFKVMQP